MNSIHAIIVRLFKKKAMPVQTIPTSNRTNLNFPDLVEHADPFNNLSVLFPYTADKLSPKKKNKKALQKQLGLNSHVNVPMAAVFVSMMDTDGLYTLKHVFDGIMSIGLELVIVDNKNHEAEEILGEEMDHYMDKVRKLQESEEVVSKVLAAADIYLSPGKSKPHYLGQILALKYGVVPIMHQSENLDGILEDYDPRSEAGHAFLYPFHNHWSFFASVVRALETYKLPYDWNTIVRNSMKVEV